MVKKKKDIGTMHIPHTSKTHSNNSNERNKGKYNESSILQWLCIVDFVSCELIVKLGISTK